MYNGSESGGEIEVVVGVLQGELSGPVVVRIYTMDGTALSDTDYQSVNITLTFSPATTTAVISVPLLNDDIDEEDEDINARLELEPEDGQQNVQIDPDEAKLIIIDDDGEFRRCSY
ncbi:MAG: hypothetical protein A6F71_10890 [Cycloclasticus sp. symbiont of Poecilosclerida sp. M]|nr:MAG: hypothetical protein A6F71_10890 [Cycloclasticus sp. symbiont of Poecilosclerida sp. M]